MTLDKLFEENIFSLDQNKINLFGKFAELLVSYNEKVNLTAITDEEEINLKHFYDSCLPLKTGYIKDGMKIIDVGCGGGFPSIPLKIANPTLEFTLMDSTRKKTDFLSLVVNELGFDKTDVINMRAEDGGRDKNLREKFDMATARAVAPLNILMEYCSPFVKVGGYFTALKGKNAVAEAEEAKNAAGTLGLKLAERFEYVLPGTDNIRNIFVYEKVKSTGEKYPRPSGRPSKAPL